MNLDGSPSLQDKGGRLANEVLGYLLRHPEAQDTVEGIAEWWLLERRVEEALTYVTKVLRELVTKDFLVASKCEDGRIYYRLNRAMEREIRAQLRGPGPVDRLKKKSKGSDTTS